jgi:hypothetical protein
LAAALGDDPNFATTISTQIGNKVDKVAGKQLSTEDYTTVEKTKLAGIQDGANNYTHPATHPATMVTGLSTVATSGSFNDLDDKPAPFDPGTLATVATTGSYTDLSNKPTLPSTLSQLTDDTTHRLVTDTEKSTWNFKQNALSGDVTDHYHTADRYTHPANHPASMVTGLATVATTGNYLDLSGKPTIPTKTSDLTNEVVLLKSPMANLRQH